MTFATISVLLWIAFSYCLAICVIGSAANLLALICITRSPILNTGMKVILLNAFLPSFLSSSILMPLLSSLFLPSSSLEEEEEIQDGRLSIDCRGKLFFPNVFFAFLCAITFMELLGLSLVSLYRYWAISSPGRYCAWISIAKTLTLCAVCWLSSLALWGCIWGTGFITFDAANCSFEGHHALAQNVTVSFIFALPLFITVALQLSTQRKIRQQDRKTNAIRASTHSLQEVRVNLNGQEHLHPMSPCIDHKNRHSQIQINPKCSSLPSSSSIMKSKRSSFYKKSLDLVTWYSSLKPSPVKKEAKRFLKVTNQIWVILVVFCIANIPHVIIHMFSHEKIVEIFIALHCLQWSHLVLDPLIYLVINKKEFHSLLAATKTKIFRCS